MNQDREEEIYLFDFIGFLFGLSFLLCLL